MTNKATEHIGFHYSKIENESINHNIIVLLRVDLTVWFSKNIDLQEKFC